MNSDRTTTYKDGRALPPGGQRSTFFLCAAFLCYGAAGVVLICKDALLSLLGLHNGAPLLAVIADDLWSLPSALVILGAFLAAFFFCPGPYRKKAVNALPRIALLVFFLYTLFPLHWAGLRIVRAPESFPSYSPFEFIPLLLALGGTVYYLLYCFLKLPPGAVMFTEKVTSHLYRCKEGPFITLLTALCFLTTAGIAYLVLNHIPHVLDSIAQLFQAKILHMGKLWVPPHRLKEFFDYAHVINEGRWYAQYPPGHALLLMLGLAAGAPWLVGPLIGALSFLVFYRLVKETYADPRITYLSALLLLFCPFFLFMSSSYMNHTSATLFILFFLYFYQRMFSSLSSRYALMAGLSLGYAISIRPLDAIAMGFPFICYLIYAAYQKKGAALRNASILAATLALMVALLLAYNNATNGSPFTFGYQQKYQTLGFLGNAQGWSPRPHTLKGGIINTSNNLIALNQYLFEWPIPSLALIFVSIPLLFSSREGRNKWDQLWLAACLTLTGSYFFYYHQDYIFGPRFYYSLTPLLIMLTIRAFLALPPWLAGRGFCVHRVTAALNLFLLACCLYTLCCSVPFLMKKYSRDYWWVTDKLHNLVRQRGVTNALIFIDCWHPFGVPTPRLIYYGSGFQFNSPDLTDDVIYALDLGERNGELMQAFPGRRYYRCNFFWDRSVEAW